MLKRTLIGALLAAVLVPSAASAQSFGVAARGGSTGLGGEAAVQITDEFAVRGGVGFFPFTYSSEFTDVRYTVAPPSRIMNAGLDFYPGLFGLRIGGGFLAISDETTLAAEYTGEFEVDGQTYTSDEIQTLDGFLAHGPSAPYVNVGYGRHASRGLGVFADFGAAFLSQQNVRLVATGPMADDPDFQERLERERVAIETDIRRYLTVLPVVSLGLRYGF
jgi:hypothetical protein